MKASLLARIPLLLLLLVTTRCSSSPQTGSSVLRLRLHDTPPDDPAITSVVVVIDRLALREQERGWVEIGVTPGPIDLMTLTGGLSTLLAQQVIQPGTYSELRLNVGAAHVVRSGAEISVDVPSGTSSGIKLKGSMTIVPDTLVELSLDFDPGQSLHATGDGKYVLHPVITVDGQTVTPGAATARYVVASEGGRLTLPSGVDLQIPPGALPTSGTISIVQELGTALGGTLVGPAFHFYPTGLQFLAPVTVTLPYDPALIPTWSDEASLFVMWDWAVVAGSIANTSEHTITGQVSHFSDGQSAVRERRRNPHPCVWIFEGGGPGDSYALAIVDTWCPHVVIRGVEAPTRVQGTLGNPADQVPWDDGATFGVTTLRQQTDGGAFAAINTAAFHCGWLDRNCDTNEDSVYRNTASVNGRWRRFGSEEPPWLENRMAIPETPSSSTKIQLRPFASSTKISALNRHNVIGSTTTIAWDGGFQTSAEARHDLPGEDCTAPKPELCCELRAKQPRTVLGVDRTMRYLFMFVNGGDPQGRSCNMDNPRGKTTYEVYQLLRRDWKMGDVSAQAEHAIWLDSGRSSTFQEGEVTLVKPNSNVPPEGRSVIAGLAVFPAPTPAFYRVTPPDAGFGQEQTFSIIGKDMPGTTAWHLKDCVGDNKVTIGDSRIRKFSCVPLFTPGAKDGVVKAWPDAGEHLQLPFQVDVLE
jgi:hypothetical protein